MKYSLQFSNAIHILAYIDILKETEFLSSEMIATSVETNPTNVRKIMSKLKKSELIQTQVGKPRPTLTRPPEEITLLDIYRSIEGHETIIQVDKKTNPNCIVGGNIQEALESKYEQIQQVVEAEMATITLLSIIETIQKNTKKKQRRRHDL